MTITEFIETVAPKLALPIMPSYDRIKGSDLRETGQTEIHGKPVKDEKYYRIPSPIVIKDYDHSKKLRLAWLRGGKQAVKNYLGKFLKQGDVQQVIRVL